MSDESPEKELNPPETSDLSEVEDLGTALPSMSRRRFLSSAAVGAAGLALSFHNPESVFAQQETADVTVDGILLTLLPAPLGSTGSSSWTVTQTFASTFTFRAEANLSLSLSASVTDVFGNPATGTFSVGSTTNFNQSTSVQVTDAITIRRTVSFSVTTASPGTVGNTLFLGISSPRINFKGNTTRLLWKFINNSAGGFLALSVSDLQSGVWDSVVRPSTRNSWLAQYPLITNPTGSSLVKPRYKKRYTIHVSPGASVNFSLETADGSSFAINKTLSISAEIIDRTTFMSPTLNTTFQTGNKITITLTSVQEVSSTRIIRFSTVLQRTTPGTFLIYKDKVLKTWLVVDGGSPATSGQPVVRGVVNGDSGGVVAGAVVSMEQSTSHTYVAGTDGTGNYVLASPAGNPMSTGSYPILTGNVSQSVNVTSGTSYSNFYSVNPTSAQQPQYFETAPMME